jgi:hypothetical protein
MRLSRTCSRNPSVQFPIVEHNVTSTCSQRADDWNGYCQTPNANVQTYVPSQIGAVGNKIWAGCRVNVGECPNFPQYSKQDVYETQPTVAACSQRVSDYVYWCQSPGNGSGYTYSQFWSNGNYLGEKIGYGPTFRYVSGSFSGPPSLPTCAASSCNWSTLNSTCYSASLRRNPSTGQNETLSLQIDVLQ